MNKKFALNVPLNQVSFGMVSTALSRAIYRKSLSPCIFPIANVDLSAQKIDPEFGGWLTSCIGKCHKMHNRKDTTIKLWHISDLMASYSQEQVAITFHETDQLTETEVNVCNNQKVTFVTSNYSREVFESYGVKNVKYLPLGFDKNNFYKIDKSYLGNDIIVFGLFGKLEPNRKRHLKVLENWVKKYGNNRKYMLHAALFNVFMKPEDQSNIINQCLSGVKYWNVNFLPYCKTNAEYCDILNSINIIISLSGGEARDLPTYHSVGLGKHCVGLRAHAYLDYLNDDNAVLISPNAKIKAADNMFFHENQPFNQGNFFDWSPDDFLSACDVAIDRYTKNTINVKGLELQNQTYDNTIDTILAGI